jgi:hypothetical protein
MNMSGLTRTLISPCLTTESLIVFNKRWSPNGLPYAGFNRASWTALACLDTFMAARIVMSQGCRHALCLGFVELENDINRDISRRLAEVAQRKAWEMYERHNAVPHVIHFAPVEVKTSQEAAQEAAQNDADKLKVSLRDWIMDNQATLAPLLDQAHMMPIAAPAKPAHG